MIHIKYKKQYETKNIQKHPKPFEYKRKIQKQEVN
jgi:hypothetical protein